MKVGELWYGLGLRPDRQTWEGARRQFRTFGRGLERDANGVGQRVRNSLFGGKGKGGKGGGLMGANVGNPFKLLAGGIGAGGAALGVGAAGAAAGVAYKDAINFDEALTRLDIASRGAMGSLAQVRSRILGVSEVTGVAKESLLEGANSFVALTGDGKAATEAMQTFARVQKATGADMGDIASSAAAMNQQMGISAPQFEKAFSILVKGGKEGAVELKDMAGLMASLSAQFSKFSGSQGTSGLASLGAAFQITRQGFGSASEAATGLEALMGSLVQKAGDLKKKGVRVFEADGKTLKSLDGIVNALANKGLNQTKLFDLLGRKEAVAAFNQLTKNRQAWGNLADATMNANDVAEDYDKFNQSSAAQLQKSWNDLKITISEALSPDRVATFTRGIQGLIRVAGTLVDMLGFAESILGAGKVATQDQQDAFEDFAKSPIVQKVAGSADRNQIAEKLAAGDLDAVLGAMGISQKTFDIKAGGAGQIAREAATKRADLAKYGLSPGYADARNMEVESSRFVDAPTLMEQESVRGNWQLSSNVVVNAPSGLNEEQVAQLAGREVGRVLETKARELAAHLGQ